MPRGVYDRSKAKKKSDGAEKTAAPKAAKMKAVKKVAAPDLQAELVKGQKDLDVAIGELAQAASPGRSTRIYNFDLARTSESLISIRNAVSHAPTGTNHSLIALVDAALTKIVEKFDTSLSDEDDVENVEQKEVAQATPAPAPVAPVIPPTATFAPAPVAAPVPFNPPPSSVQS